MQEPADNDADSKQQEHQQRAGQLDGPDQELDLHDRNILNNKEDREPGKDQYEQQLVIH